LTFWKKKIAKRQKCNHQKLGSAELGSLRGTEREVEATKSGLETVLASRT